jgi:hypothetical protein
MISVDAQMWAVATSIPASTTNSVITLLSGVFTKRRDRAHLAEARTP